MKLLSIDVGIKNLAFCLFEKNNDVNDVKIIKWNVVNVGEQEILYCTEINKDGIYCSNIAKYKRDNKCFCVKHSKKQVFIAPNAELKLSFIHKQKLQKLYEMADKYNLTYEKPTKKCEIISLLNDYVADNCFEVIETTNASKLDLISIGKIIKIKFDELFDSVGKIDCIIIENQISPIANRMKTIQGMIAQYFIMKNVSHHIEFVSSSNKLKEFIGEDKTKYGVRKKLGITKCVEYLNEVPQYMEWKEYFTKHKKKDDLSDAFLQGIWYLNFKMPAFMKSCL